jgi:hypothetical protein
MDLEEEETLEPDLYTKGVRSILYPPRGGPRPRASTTRHVSGSINGSWTCKTRPFQGVLSTLKRVPSAAGRGNLAWGDACTGVLGSYGTLVNARG